MDKSALQILLFGMVLAVAETSGTVLGIIQVRTEVRSDVDAMLDAAARTAAIEMGACTALKFTCINRVQNGALAPAKSADISVHSTSPNYNSVVIKYSDLSSFNHEIPGYLTRYFDVPGKSFKVVALYPERQFHESWENRARPVVTAGYIGLSGTLAFLVVLQLLMRKWARAQQKLSFDSDTGLETRTSLKRSIRSTLAGKPQKESWVMVLNLDLVRHVSDAQGQQAGNEIILEIARRLRSFGVRTVGIVARDEIGFVVEDPIKSVASRLHQLLDLLEHPISIEGDDLPCHPRLGVAVFPKDGTTADELLQAASLAVRSRKQSEVNRVIFFSPEMASQAYRKLSLETALGCAISNGELYLEFQPIVDISRNTVVKAEALLRWKMRDGRQIPPDEFIPLADANGSIAEIGCWVLREACKWAKEINEDKQLEPIVVSVNVSAIQLDSGMFAEEVAEALASSGLPPELLELEITERILVSESSRVQGALRDLMELGVAFSLDDFGTGYSSLIYLTQIPVRTLKLDKAFIRGIETSEKMEALVKGILLIADALHISVVAEGVETRQQQSFLKDAGCSIHQGWLYARSVPPHQFHSTLSAIIQAL